MSELLRFDRRALGEAVLLAGIDEAGRGALAGPVVAGAVILDRALLQTKWAREEMALVNDSKQLTAARRERLFAGITEAAVAGLLRAAPGIASVEEIARWNILGANRRAMQRALEEAAGGAVALPAPGDDSLFAGAVAGVRIVIDGKPVRPFPYVHEGVVKGDAKSFAIALASIVAKVTRDSLMQDLDQLYPQYGFRIHKGYATSQHREAILAHGPCPLHRRRFLRKLLGEAIEEDGEIGEPAGQNELFG